LGIQALTVLEYLVGHGSERVIHEIREHAYQIQVTPSTLWLFPSLIKIFDFFLLYILLLGYGNALTGSCINMPDLVQFPVY